MMKTEAIRMCIQFRQEYETDSGIHLAQRASAELAALVLVAENAKLGEALASKQEERAFGELYTLGDSEETGRKEERLNKDTNLADILGDLCSRSMCAHYGD